MAAMTQKYLFYVGTYSVRGSAGLYQVEMDGASGAMRVVSQATGFDPSYLALSPDERTLYAVEESVSGHGLTPSVAAYAIGESGGLRLRGRLPIPGLSPCHVAVSPDGRWLVTSNYSDGSNTVVAVDHSAGLSHVVHQSVNAGSLGPHERQEAPHAHYAQFIGRRLDGWRVYSCDLGLDRIVPFELNGATGQLQAISGEGASLPASAGPRHFADHPALQFLYAFGELDSTVYAYSKQPNANSDNLIELDLVQIIPTLPSDSTGVNLGAAIKISPGEGVLTVSNRGQDSLVSFSINEQTGLLSPLSEVNCGGEWPRDFAYVGTEFLVVANERSDNLAAVPGRLGRSAPADSLAGSASDAAVSRLRGRADEYLNSIKLVYWHR